MIDTFLFAKYDITGAAVAASQAFHPLCHDTETINTKVSGAVLIASPCVSVSVCKKKKKHVSCIRIDFPRTETQARCGGRRLNKKRKLTNDEETTDSFQSVHVLVSRLKC
ncbi:uncharacterized [Tachysurus ichikawai]